MLKYCGMYCKACIYGLFMPDQNNFGVLLHLMSLMLIRCENLLCRTISCLVTILDGQLERVMCVFGVITGLVNGKLVPRHEIIRFLSLVVSKSWRSYGIISQTVSKIIFRVFSWIIPNKTHQFLQPHILVNFRLRFIRI